MKIHHSLYIGLILLLISQAGTAFGLHGPSRSLADPEATVEIPDTNFKSALIDFGVDTNGDSEIQYGEAESISGELWLVGKGITDLTGIEAFLNVMVLKVNYNNLSAIDVTANIALKELHAQSNQLSSVDLSNNPQLNRIRLQDNSLTALDLSQNSKLTYLDVTNNNLNLLDVKNGNNSNMSRFYASGNPDLTCIQVDDVTYMENNFSDDIDPNASFSLNCGDGPEITYVKPELTATSSTDLPLPESTEDKSLDLITDTGYPTYRWYKDGDLLVENNSNSLTLNDESGELFSPSDTGDYTVVLVDTEGNASLTSDPVTVTYEEPEPEITSFTPTLNASNSTDLPLPESTEDKSLDLIADSGYPTYQWRKDGVLVVRNTSNILTLNNAEGSMFEPDDAGDYTVILEDEEGNESRISNTVTVTYTQTGTVYIPDANFKAALITTGVDTNGDSKIQYSEAEAITGELRLVGEGIADLTGIEAFLNITVLKVNFNNLTGIDLSSNASLQELHAQGNNISSLDLSNNPELNRLRFHNNSLTSIDLSTNSKLTYIDLTNNNLNSLNVKNGNNSNMSRFYANENPDLTCIQVDDVTYMENNFSDDVDAGASFSLSCGGDEGDPDISTLVPDVYATSSTDLPLPESTEDKSLSLIAESGYNNYKWYLDGALVQDSSENSLMLNNAEGDMFDPADTGDYTVVVAYSDDNFSQHSEPITVTYSESNDDTAPDVVYIPDANFKAALITTGVDTNGDSEIQYSEAEAITGELRLVGEGIADLTGIEAFVNLTILKVNFNNLTGIDLSSNTALRELHAQGNNISSLDLSNNPQLDRLRFHNNSLTSIDLSTNSKLTYIDLTNNNLNALNVKNGNNSNMSRFYASENPDLTCIQVDDVTYMETNFSDDVDAGASFSLSCGGDEGDPDISTLVPEVYATSSTDLPLPESTEDKSLSLVAASGYNNYKWYLDGSLIQDSTENSLMLNNAEGDMFDPADTGDYTVVVAYSDDNFSQHSEPITVTYSDEDPLPSGEGVHFAFGTSIRDGKHSHYYKMVTWDDSDYKEFAYWEEDADGRITDFMNFRIMFPNGYDEADPTTEYPMIMMLHGAGESGRKWTGHYNWDPSDPEYDNNGLQLKHGGKQHRDAVNRDPSDSQAFPGFVVFPQTSYNGSWGSSDREKLAAFVEYFVETYHVDQDRIVMHGLSNGAKASWKMAVQRPDLFAAILPMSGVGSGQDEMTDSLFTTPIWLFQGSDDTNPTLGAAEGWIGALEDKGGTPKLTVYDSVGHFTWNKAYAEPDFFSWIMEKDKKNIHIMYGRDPESPENDLSDPIVLGFSANFPEYQWTRDGMELAGETDRLLTTTSSGVYTVKFKRRTDSSWAESYPITITYGSSSARTASAEESPIAEPTIYPNPFVRELNLKFADDSFIDEKVMIYDNGGRMIRTEELKSQEISIDLGGLSSGLYILRIGNYRYRLLKE